MSRARPRLIVAALIVVALATGSAVAALVPLRQFSFVSSAFTSTTSNTGSSLSAAATFPTYPQAVLDDNPLVYYRGDDAAGSATAADSSGHGTTGTYSATAATFQVPGGPGQGDDTAVRFSGVTYVTASSNATLVNPNTFTEEVWFKTTTTAGGRLLSLGTAEFLNSGTSDRYISMLATGALRFGAGATTITSPATGYNNGAWHLAAASLGPGGMKLYVDGAQVAINAGITAGLNYTGHWRLGGEGGGYFAGTLDEPAIYLSELTAGRISAHYTSGTTATTLAGYTAVVAADTPWLLWHLDEAPLAAYRTSSWDTPIIDYSGNGRDGVYRNVRPRSVVAGGAGALVGGQAASTSVRFGPAGGGYDPTTVANPTAYTYEMWFRTSSTIGGELIGFGNQPVNDSTQYDRVVYMLDDGRLAFGIYTGALVVITSTGAYNDGAWHHLVASQGAAGLVMYVDTVVVASNPAPGAAEANTNYFRWGGDTLSGWPSRPTSNYFNGDLDEVAIYLAQLGPLRVIRHYHANH